MKKLTEEQFNQITHDVFNEMYPDYTDEDNDNFKTNLLNTILTAIVKFAEKYQQEIDE